MESVGAIVEGNHAALKIGAMRILQVFFRSVQEVGEVGEEPNSGKKNDFRFSSFLD